MGCCDALFRSLHWLWGSVPLFGRQHAPELQGTKWHARYRVFDSATERWNTKDPLEYQAGVNLYECFGANPIANVDAFGLISLPCDMGACDTPAPPPNTGPISMAECFAGSRDRAECTSCCSRAWSPASYLGCRALCWALHPLDPPQLPPPGSIADCLVPTIHQPNRDSCNVYGKCDCLYSINVRCMCKCMGNDNWSQFVRACLQCMRRLPEISWADAHCSTTRLRYKVC